MKTSASLLLVCTVLLLGLALPASVGVGAPASAGQTDQKIRLMSEALKLRDAGDLAGARGKLEALLILTPNDVQVRRLLDSVDAAIAARAAAPAPAPAPAPVAVTVNLPSEPVTIPSAPAEAAPAPAPAANNAAAAAEAEAEAMAAAETRRLQNLISEANEQRNVARNMARDGRIDDAVTTLDNAARLLPRNPLTQPVLVQIESEKADLERRRSSAAPAAGNPGRAEIDRMIAKGRGQYLAGEADAAQETFRSIEAIDADNATAKSFLMRIAREKAELGVLNREKTRAQLLEEVTKSWQRPGIYQERSRTTTTQASVAPLMDKLNRIVLPTVSYTNVELARVVSLLSDASVEFDKTGETARGVNIVLIGKSDKEPNPIVNITLRNLSLKRVLDMVAESVGYQYEVQADAVVLRPGGETSSLETAFFPISHATVLRMSGQAETKTDGAAPTENSASADAALRNFLQRAGVIFEGVNGASLAFDGASLIVTQTPRNLERIRNILGRYNDVKQVEIESKFMEVQEGALDELGVNWNVSRRGVPQINPTTGAPVLDANGRQVYTPRETYATAGVNRNLAQAFTGAQSASSIIIDGQPVASTAAPKLPGSVHLAESATALANITGFVGEFDVSAVVRALSQKQGTDLLSAPKVTVLSGNKANIKVVQEMLYPGSYGEIQSQVGTGTATGAGSSAGVTITAGTPQEFKSKNVGVELDVTPTVEEDDYAISLDLNPKVTEFEGFVEYGGPSLAISGGTSVTVPPGFYQPIFSVREVTTKVTIWDGATLVMGGLTREDVKKVNDKVPFFGDIPLLGRLFRSKGESSQKRNLLIFVTANLVSPGGSPKKQELKSVAPGSMFQNPTIVTPSNAEPRTRSSK